MSELNTAGTQIRYQIMDFLNNGTTETPEWFYMNQGFNSLDESPAAQINTKAYVGDRSASGIVTGYQTVFPFNIDLIPNQAPINKIYQTATRQLTGGEAEADYIRVDAFNVSNADPDTYPARKFRVSIQVDSITGAGTEIINLAGQLNNVGTFVEGTFNTSTKTFTPAA
jgi:hypothetical protein